MTNLELFFDDFQGLGTALGGSWEGFLKGLGGLSGALGRSWGGLGAALVSQRQLGTAQTVFADRLMLAPQIDQNC